MTSSRLFHSALILSAIVVIGALDTRTRTATYTGASDFVDAARSGSTESIDKPLQRSSAPTESHKHVTADDSDQKCNDTSYQSVLDFGMNVSQFLVTPEGESFQAAMEEALEDDGDEEEEEWEFEDQWEMEDEEDDEEEYEDEYLYLDEDGPGTDFGLPQIIDPSEIAGRDADKFNQTAVFENLKETAAYMTNEVMQDDFYEKVRDLCFNYHPLCAAWAAHGECEENTEYMDEVCAPACMRCEQLHYETRCPHDDSMTNIWQPGDVNKMFERIVSDRSFKTQVLSRPGKEGTTDDENDAPWVVAIDDFLSAEESIFLTKMGTKLGFEKNTVSGGIDEETGEAEENIEDEAITSSSVWCIGECDSHAVTASIFQRVEHLTGIPLEYAEHLQLVKYDKGEYYLTHHDYVAYEQMYMAGPRILTILMYFNDVEEGGETYFSQLDLTIKPKMGRVVVFSNVLNDQPDALDERLEHEARPIAKGQKYVANLWLHLRNLNEAAEKGCY